MKIKKLAHCCLVIDMKAGLGGSAAGAVKNTDRRILVDPGSYSIEKHDKIAHADIVLITHEHADHFHIESLKALLKRSPKSVVITDVGVGDILAKAGIEHRVMRHGERIEVDGVIIEAYGKDHAIMHGSLPLMSNIGFFISGDAAGRSLFFPGDAFTVPVSDGATRTIDALALPVAGPWMKLSEAIDYALAVEPRIAFPVHDGLRGASQHLIPERVLGKNGIEFIKLEEDGVLELSAI